MLGRMAELNLTQRAVAQRAGLSTSYISDLMNGKRGGRISIATVQKLSVALEVEPSFFWLASPICGDME